MGGVTNGQPVDAPTTNAAFIEKNAADSMPYPLTFNNTATASGASVTDSQKEHNSIASFVGKALNAVYNALPSWATSNRGLSNDTLFARIEALDTAFHATTGHKHTGATGDAPTLGATAFPVMVGATSGAAGTQGAVPQPLAGQQTLFLRGDGTWAAAGGGGGGSLEWVESTNAPTPSVDNNNQVYAFQSGLGQSLYALIKVPSGYTTGNQIQLKLDFYSPDSSGTALIQSVATLIRQGTDAMSSTTNQRTSTNSAVTLGAGTVNIPKGVALDLSDSTGNVNAVAVSPGDYIQVQLTRGTDTGTSDLKVPVYGAEVTFQ